MQLIIQIKQNMKFPLVFLFVSLLAIGFSGCEDEILGPVIPEGWVELKHDGAQDNAAELPPTLFKAATRFTAAELAQHQGGQLKDVWFYLAAKPATCVISVWSSSGGNVPITQEYSKSVITSVSANSWNQHTLDVPVDIGTDDLWILVEFSASTTQRTMGCDAGPSENDGDWLWDSADNQWIKMSDRTSGAININWNIRGAIEP